MSKTGRVLACTGLLLGAASVLAAIPLNQIPNGRGSRLSGPPGEQFGAAVAGVGDLNSDGFGDVAVGAPAASRPGVMGVGAVYVFFGSANPGAQLSSAGLTGSNGFKLSSATQVAGSALGLEVAAAGDVNNDGVDDLLVGSRRNSAPVSQAQSVYVVFGRPAGSPFPASVELDSLNGSNGFVIAAEGLNDQLGSSRTLAGDGDVNNDLFADLLLGAPARNSAGRAYLVLGRSSFPALLNLSGLTASTGSIFTTVAAGTLGSAVSIGGRVNNDDFSELLIGNRATASNTGAGFGVYGRTPLLATQSVDTLDETSGFGVVGAATGQELGAALSLVGDLDADGPEDAAFGAPGNTSGNGAVHVIYGSFAGLETQISLASINGSNGFSVTGAGGERLGSEVVRLGDRNLDLRDDLGLVAPNASPGGISNAGRIYVLYGREPPTAASFTAASLDNASNGEVYDGVTANGQLDLANAGKFDSDQRPDLIIGVPAANEAYVVLRDSSGIDQLLRNGFE